MPAGSDSVCDLLSVNDIQMMDNIFVVARPPSSSLTDNGSQLSRMTPDGLPAECSFDDANGDPTDGRLDYTIHVKVERPSDFEHTYRLFTQGNVCMQRERLQAGSCPRVDVEGAEAYSDQYAKGPTVWTVFDRSRGVVVTANWPELSRGGWVLMREAVHNLDSVLPLA